jgi:hypothetical protein
MAAVKDRRQLVLGDDLVEAIGHAIVGEEALNGRMELEPFYDPRRDQIARFAHAHLALVRIDRGESHHDVRVGGGGLRNLVVRDPPGADFEFAVNREHHQANLALAIIGDRLGDGRALARLEVFACGVFIRLPESVRRLPAGNLRVGVDVDRHEVADVHCLCSLVGAASRSAPDSVATRRSPTRRRRSTPPPRFPPPRPPATIAWASHSGPMEAASFYVSPGIVLCSAST